MADNMMAENAEALGSVVAFEGHAETVSTQLRLLPTSPQILILPSIQCYLPMDKPDDEFEAQQYIKRAHDAVMARNDTARAFLQGSTANNKRLVFMNGGAPNAQALCIRAIMRHETEGDDVKAQAIFDHVVKEGLGGLEKQWKGWKIARELEHIREEEQDEEPQDPITRAMRAADALDRQTANLQPSTDLDLTIVQRPRSMSLPLYGYSDNFGDAAPFFVFGSNCEEDSFVSFDEDVVEDEEDEFVPKTPRFSVTHYDEPEEQSPYTGFTNLHSPAPRSPPPRSPSCIGESYGPGTALLYSPNAAEFFTPRSEFFGLRSPDNVVFGEAALLDMRPSVSKPPLPRVRSLDRIYPASPKFRDLCIPEEPSELEQPRPMLTNRPHSWMVLTDTNDPTTAKVSTIEGPRTIVVRPKRPAVTMSPVPPEKKRKPVRASYVDRGTDAEVVKEEEPPFEPVLPVTEDLVVYFKDDVPDALLDSLVDAFRNGTYPVVSSAFAASAAAKADDDCDKLPGTPESNSILEQDEPEEPVDPRADTQDAEEDPNMADCDDYDPFAYVQPSRPTSKPITPNVNVPTMVERPPTPEETPPPSISDKQEKFREFNITAGQTAVTVQNSLRSVLNVYFPPEAQGYHQFTFSLLPELEGLWKPIFREAEPGSPRTDNRKMDQIFAIGSQHGVKRDYFCAISGQLEKLGTKASGVSRSGRLDFRYLLANAMQAFTAQPLANQTSDNPFTNPCLLATLLIPHLETYLALHAEVRYLLLEYPPEHLPTILAMQRLVGVDLMKVAQIVDSKAKELLPFTHLRGASISSGGSGGARGGSPDAPRSSSPLGKPVSPSGSGSSATDVTVSRANFLLTSAASDAEIATFISTVWRILAEISDFYAPDEPQPPPAAPTPAPGSTSSRRPTPKDKKPKPAPLQSVFNPLPSGAIVVPTTPVTPMPPQSGSRTPRAASPAPSTRAPSISDTVRTWRSARSKHSRTKSTRARSRGRRPPTADAASVFTFDPAEDSDYDQEERRLMPYFAHRPKPRKGNNRKALKFLGLA